MRPARSAASLLLTAAMTTLCFFSSSGTSGKWPSQPFLLSSSHFSSHAPLCHRGKGGGRGRGTEGRGCSVGGQGLKRIREGHRGQGGEGEVAHRANGIGRVCRTRAA